MAGSGTRSHWVCYKISLGLVQGLTGSDSVWYKVSLDLVQGVAGSYTCCSRVWYKILQGLLQGVLVVSQQNQSSIGKGSFKIVLVQDLSKRLIQGLPKVVLVEGPPKVDNNGTRSSKAVYVFIVFIWSHVGSSWGHSMSN